MDDRPRRPATGPIAPFVRPDSIVRRIWGDADAILFVFAGSAAEFALNRAVDWLFFSGKLPADPLGRLFTTARFAQEIAFVDEATARRSLHRIGAAHRAVEHRRAEAIPEWAHRDVLYMLIDYSERAFELLSRPLDAAERDELYGVFRRVGEGLAIPGLPPSYADWIADRRRHLERDLAYSGLTARLYDRYREVLGRWRYRTLLRVQSVLVPEHVRRLLGLEPCPWMRPSLAAYKVMARVGLRPLVHRMIMPPETLPRIKGLDHAG
ncbi:oxygenase MpaB family protein [Tautonia plasticadhaerens]|uniref:ER-bound oxygenase mpaB/mpaB'/Rubber oxygenase catalytic domain-containing protein n=1 Tax=Tautonia plasticadhaerens TaxID=2527974 RepID=A0A518H390_9BACT|nr:oxygenase MpaB family protein [Tautonia plasticadhaerens]QDV35303.1 hypothetical protein ElP_32060 [Tautonia plasticadhaerens]